MDDDFLAGSFAKINWARRHVKELDRVVERELRSRPHELSHQFNADTGYFQIVWDPPPLDPEYGLRIGDAVHNLRSALDLAIWELTERNEIDPSTLTNPRPEFPIERTEQRFKERRGPQKIRGLSDEMQRVVCDNQPYVRGNEADSDPLAILGDLSNADKHRVITPVQAAVHIDTEAIDRVLAENVEFIEPGYFVSPVGVALKPRQDVVRFRPLPGREPKMQVKVGTQAEVAFEQGPLVIPALDEMGARVEGVIRHLVNTAS